MTAWIVGALVVLVVLPFLLARRQRVQRRFVRERSPEFEAKIAALTEWLGVPRIRDAIREFEGAPFEAQDGLRLIVGRMDEASVDHVLYERILQFRQVRQVVAHHMLLAHGIPRHEAMKALLEWSGKKEAA